MTAASAPRTVRIAPDRLVGWLDRFTAAHGSYEVTTPGDGLTIVATDGTRAHFRPPAAAAAATCVHSVRELLAVATTPATVGLLIVRKGGFAVGVARGVEIVSHRTGSRYVQGRTAAGGSSQGRFMRRRQNQATAAYAKAQEAIETVVLPHATDLTAVIAAGDRAGLRVVLGAPPLQRLAALLHSTMAPSGEPRRAALDDLLAWARAVPCEVTDPPTPATFA